MNKKIIVFIGVIGSGKTYSANKLMNEDSEIINFAEELRENVWNLIGWKPTTGEDYDEFKKFEFKFKDISFTGRDILAKLGTDIMRKYNDSIWIDCWKEKATNSDKQLILVDDCRFENEMEEILKFCETNNYDSEFIFCNYKSYRYRLLDHESEKLATSLLDKYTDGETISFTRR